MIADPFVRHRAFHVATAIAANLGRIVRDGAAMGIGRGGGGSAVVIGGGPSCHSFERIGREVLTFCVNTSAPKVCDSFVPDVLVVRECIGVADQIERLRHKPKLALVEIGTSPTTVSALVAAPVPIAWVVPAQPILTWLAMTLKTRPVYGGESAMTLAVATATRLGCDVSLLGCDLAFGADGTAYGDGTAWSGVKVSRSGTTVDFGDRGGMAEHARRSGVAGPPLREHATPVMMEDGSEGLALATWTSQRLWCEQWARRHPGVTFSNMSGGAKIEGWERISRVDGSSPGVPLDTLDVSGIDAEVRRQLRLCREAHESDAPWTIGDSMSGWPLVDFAAARDIAETSARDLPLPVALADRRPLMRRACDAIEAAYAGGSDPIRCSRNEPTTSSKG